MWFIALNLHQIFRYPIGMQSNVLINMVILVTPAGLEPATC